jgi:AraC-like DNA-binding protein
VDAVLLSPANMETLAHPERWRIVFPQRPEERSTASGRISAKRRRWAKAHHHRHPYCEILLALGGTCRYGVGGRLYACPPGTVVALDRSLEHENGYPAGRSDFDHLWLHLFETNALYALYSARGGRIRSQKGANLLLHYHEVGLHPGRDVFVEGEGALAEPAWREARVRTFLGACVLRILERAQADDRDRGDGVDLQETVVEAIRAHIHETRGNGVSLDNLAYLAGYSKFHFSRLFKRHTGLTVHRYIDLVRLQTVGEMEARGCSRREMSETLGFSCPAAFSRWRRKAGGRG